MDNSEKLATLLKHPMSPLDEPKWEGVVSEDDLYALINKQSQMLKIIRGDVDHIHKNIRRVAERLEIFDKGHLKQTLGITQEAVSRAFCEKIRPDLLERLGAMERQFSSFKQHPRSFKEIIRVYGLTLAVSFLSALACALSFHALLPPKQRFSAYTPQLLGYGHTLKEAWPHLTDKEKERLKSAGKKTGKKGRL